MGAAHPGRNLGHSGPRQGRQFEHNVAALNELDFSPGELAEIDRYATDGGINLWAASSAS